MFGGSETLEHFGPKALYDGAPGAGFRRQKQLSQYEGIHNKGISVIVKRVIGLPIYSAHLPTIRHQVSVDSKHEAGTCLVAFSDTA